MHTTFLAALHELSITLRVRSDDHDLRIERLVDILEDLHRIRSPTFLLCVEQDVPLLWDPALDHIEEDGSERVLEVGADPDEEPVVELDAGR